MKIIGTLRKITGEFFALDINGNLREIEFGDEIYSNETIVNSIGISVTDAIEKINLDNMNNEIDIESLVDNILSTSIKSDYSDKILESTITSANTIEHSNLEVNIEASLREASFSNNKEILDSTIHKIDKIEVDKIDNIKDIFEPISNETHTFTTTRDISYNIEEPNKEVPKEEVPILDDIPQNIEEPNKEVPKEEEPILEDIPLNIEEPNKEVSKEEEPTLDDIPQNIEEPNKEVPKEEEPILEDIPFTTTPIQESDIVEAPPILEDIIPNLTVSYSPDIPPINLDIDIEDSDVDKIDDSIDIIENIIDEVEILLPSISTNSMTNIPYEDIVDNNEVVEVSTINEVEKEFSITVSIDPITTNISFIVDVSSSMSDEDLALTKEAIDTLVESYSSFGDVNVNIIQFSYQDAINSGWIDAESANDIVLVDDKVGTDIQEGLSSLVETSYDGFEPEADQNIVYYFGDGDTYNDTRYSSTLFQSEFDEFTGAIRDENGDIIDTNEDSQWGEFLDSGAIDEFIAYSINTPEVKSDIAFLSDAASDSNVSSEAMAIDDISDLSDVVVESVIISQDGSLVDSELGEEITSIEIGGERVDYDEDNPIVVIDAEVGSFEIDFEDGSYTYTVSSDEYNEEHTEEIIVSAIERDSEEEMLKDDPVEDMIEIYDTIESYDSDEFEFDNNSSESEIDDSVTINSIMDVDDKDELFIEGEEDYVASSTIEDIEKVEESIVIKEIPYSTDDSSVTLEVEDKSILVVM